MPGGRVWRFGVARDQVLDEGGLVIFNEVDSQVCVEVKGEYFADFAPGGGDGFAATTRTSTGGDDHLVRRGEFFAAVRHLIAAVGQGL